ncbi:hypothetical protein [Saccharibacillus endophyticus]|uniref:Uncharacterized protein n=1 Tax=Saccharibacillus endophyticus TaxID=2060666 RepID=A0ABQ2A2S3_9BACL|nr:hypothetical protein [Saccharibacillus endophyticus]GGH83185.1 hypothetical protein GCM10007362_35640 [Saccharibacillus endophyticus]
MKHSKKIMYATLFFVLVLVVAAALFFRSYSHYKATSQYFYRDAVSDIVSGAVQVNEIAKTDQKEYTVQQLKDIEQAQSGLMLRYQDLFLLFQDESFMNATKMEFVDFYSIYLNANVQDRDSPDTAAQNVRLNEESLTQMNRLIAFVNRVRAFYLEEGFNENVELSERDTKRFMRKIEEFIP